MPVLRAVSGLFARNGIVLATLVFVLNAVWPLSGEATINATLQMQLGNPSGATNDPSNHSHYLIQRSVEALDYSDTNGEPNWASWDLTAGDVGSSGRSSTFFTDTNLPAGFYRVTSADYDGAGYDRGHMCPSDDRTDNTNDNDMVFFMSNIIPQNGDNNSGIWATFEGYCRSLATNNTELLIMCGPAGFTTNRIPSGRAVIPSLTWKIAVVVPLDGSTNSALNRITSTNRVIAIEVPNLFSVTDNWPQFVVTANQIQEDTGLTFFTALPASIAAVLRSKADGLSIPIPSITGFSPTTGPTSSGVTLAGTNFNYASAVVFNGIPAAFTVNSSNQITATIPPGATSGKFVVSSSAGSFTNQAIYTVNGSLAAEIGVAVSHAGNFTQGDLADTYTIVVTNDGTLGSSGAVIVNDYLPSGLTAVSFAGDGWSTSLPALSATRSDSLAVGSSYPPLTLTVQTATNAPYQVANVVAVTNSSDVNPLNNTNSDTTTIIPVIIGATNFTGTVIGWDVHGVTNFGVSPFSPTVIASNLTAVGLTRGVGVGTSGSGVNGGWGGSGFTSATDSLAISNSQTIGFSVAANPGYKLSLSSIPTFSYRRSSTGSPSGTLQYQVGNGGYVNVASLSYSSSNSSGANLAAINLGGIADLQNVPGPTNISFRLLNYGGTSSAGTWYVYDVAGTSAPDLSITGSISPAVVLTPLQTWRWKYFNTINPLGIASDAYANSADGLANLLKYAFGLPPFSIATNPVVGDISTGYLRITAPRATNATDIKMTAQSSGDLNVWTTNSVVIDQNTPPIFRAHDTTPVSSGTNVFMRLNVSE